MKGGPLIAEGKANLAADAAHEKELADDAEPRAARDKSSENVRQTLDDLSAKVKPSTRRGGQTEEAEQTEETGGGGTGT